MQAIILLAGYGSRLKRDDLAHKVLLPFGDDTLLSRHLRSLSALGVEKVYLVVGHNAGAVKDYVGSLASPKPPVEFIDNDLYLTTGNTLSVVLGLRRASGDVLVLDGDVLYPPSALADFVRQSAASSFATVPVDIDNIECAKVLLRADGAIAAFITKRALTGEEKSRYRFGGEAIGFFKLAAQDARAFADLYDRREKDWVTTLWEIPFSEFAGQTRILPWTIAQRGCYEIDTQHDYEEALRHFHSHPALYAQ